MDITKNLFDKIDPSIANELSEVFKIRYLSENRIEISGFILDQAGLEQLSEWHNEVRNSIAHVYKKNLESPFGKIFGAFPETVIAVCHRKKFRITIVLYYDDIGSKN